MCSQIKLCVLLAAGGSPSGGLGLEAGGEVGGGGGGGGGGGEGAGSVRPF